MNQKEKHTLESSEYQKPKPTIKMKKFSKEYPCKSLKRSIATLMEEIKIVVSEKYEFEYREESILIAYFEIFGLAGFWGKEQNEFFNSTLFYKCKAFD